MPLRPPLKRRRSYPPFTTADFGHAEITPMLAARTPSSYKRE